MYYELFEPATACAGAPACALPTEECEESDAPKAPVKRARPGRVSGSGSKNYSTWVSYTV